jgi:hypothetical protein
MAVPPNYFVGGSINEVAMCITEDQTMWVDSYPGRTMPPDVVTYPCFEPSEFVINGTVVYIPSARGYYRCKVLKR